MLRLIFLFLVIVTRIHANYLANQKNNPKMKNIIMFICMYVCVYVWKLGIILNYELFLYTTIVLNVVYIFKYHI